MKTVTFFHSHRTITIIKNFLHSNICWNLTWSYHKNNKLKKKQPPEVFYKKSVLRNFTKFTVKHLCQIFFFNKVASSDLHFNKKETLAQVFSCEICETSKEHLFYRIPLDDCFFKTLHVHSQKIGINQNLLAFENK